MKILYTTDNRAPSLTDLDTWLTDVASTFHHGKVYPDDIRQELDSRGYYTDCPRYGYPYLLINIDKLGLTLTADAWDSHYQCGITTERAR